MKLLSIQVLALSNGGAVPLSQVSDLSSFSFLQRPSISEFLSFLSRTVAERTTPGQRQSVQKDSYTAHVYNQLSSGLIGVIIADNEYPVRVAFSLLNKILDEYTAKIPKETWENALSKAVATSGGVKTTAHVDFPPLGEYIVKYQDPKQADTIMKVQQELDETKIVLHKTIESVLERGEKLDDLVERSNNLSASSKMFYKTAKKQNSCCIIS